jgi:hypothetical protein
VNPRLGRHPHQAPTVSVPGDAVRDRPAEAARGGELEPEVVVQACDWVVVLVDYEVVAVGGLVALVEG